MPLFTIQQRYKYYISCCIFLCMFVSFLVRIFPTELLSECAFFSCAFFRCAFFHMCFFSVHFFRPPFLTGAIIKRRKQDDYEKRRLIGWWGDDVALDNTFSKISTLISSFSYFVISSYVIYRILCYTSFIPPKTKLQLTLRFLTAGGRYKSHIHPFRIPKKKQYQELFETQFGKDNNFY